MRPRSEQENSRPLISEALIKIILQGQREGLSPHAQDLINWLNKCFSDDFIEKMKEGIFNEGALFEAIGYFFDFYTLPPNLPETDPILELKRDFTDHRKDEDIYMLRALESQITRLRGKLMVTLSNPETRIEKMRVSIEEKIKRYNNQEAVIKGIERMIETMEFLDRKLSLYFENKDQLEPEELEKIENHMRDTLLAGLEDNNLIRNKEEFVESCLSDVVPDNMGEYLKEARSKIVQAMPRLISVEIAGELKKLQGDLKREKRKLPKIRKDIDSMCIELARLEKVQRNSALATSILKQTLERVEILRERTKDRILAMAQESAPEISTPEPSSEEHRPSKKRKNGNGNGNSKKEEVSTDEEREEDPRSPEEKTMDEDIEKLEKAMRVAVENAKAEGKIRMIVKNVKKIAQQYFGKWEEVLRELGFKGEFIPVDYRTIKRSNDKVSPVIVYFAMNTHYEKWNPEKLKNLYVLESMPNHLLKRIQERKGRNKQGK
jgi:hypothetical protein